MPTPRTPVEFTKKTADGNVERCGNEVQVVGLTLSMGTDITSPNPAMPAGGAGVQGWLSAIWTKLNGSIATTGGASMGTDITTPSPAMPAGGAGVQGWLSAIWTYLHTILAAISAQLPAALGPTTSAGSLSVVLAPDSVKTPATWVEYNVTLTNGDTQYSQALPTDCLGFHFQVRGMAAIRWSGVAGKVATPTAPWITLKSGAPYNSIDGYFAAAKTLYFACAPADAGAVVEIVAWT
jgi:Flp pilus assembly pilin Flp